MPGVSLNQAELEELLNYLSDNARTCLTPSGEVKIAESAEEPYINVTPQ